MSKLERYAREIQLIQKLGVNASGKWRLALATLLFHARTGLHLIPPAEERPDSYPLNLLGIETEIQLRRYAGDLFVLYEVFLDECYRIPPVFNLNPQTIVDLGANVGIATLFFAQAYPQAHFVCVEPLRSNVRLLKANTTALKSQVQVIEGAVSSHSGTQTFAPSMWSWGGKLDSGASVLETVRTYTIPELLLLLPVARIDLLKVDIEGAERTLFLSDAGWLAQVDAIIIELHEGLSVSEFENAVVKYGLELVPQNSHYGNSMTLAVRRSL